MVGCRCEERASPHGSAPATSLEQPTAPLVEPPAIEPAPVIEPPPAADGVPVPATLVRQLASPNAQERAAQSGGDPRAGCAFGCALVDTSQTLTLVHPTFDHEGGLPSRLEIVRVVDGLLEREPLPLEGVPAPDQTLAADAPWASRVERALGRGAFRAAASSIASRARTVFSHEEHSPLVALGPPNDGRWLFAEVAATAYRIHLLREDRHLDRLLATLPLVPTACDGDGRDRACIAPLAIDEVFATPDGRALVALVHHAGSRAPNDDVLLLPLDDASALPSGYDLATREAELERSLRDSSLRTTPFAPSEEPMLDSRGARCLRGCALFRESGEVFVVRPTRIERGAVIAAHAFPPPDPSRVAAATEILGVEGLEPREQAAVIERALSGAPTREGRALVARQAVAFDGHVAVAPRVDLRAPHVGTRVEVVVDGEQYVIRWTESGQTREVGRVAGIAAGGHLATPSILEVYAPPDGGYPVVVVGTAAVREPSAEGGIAHGTFHVVVAR